MSTSVPLFTGPCRFIAGAATLASLPPVTYPELALVGRSNVGKSSLLNALVGQNALARVSQHPGATKQLNFFLLGERLMLVDMPGYGYARTSKAQKQSWDRLIRQYLCGRPNLKRCWVLIDARRGVMEVDEACMRMLDEAAVSFQLLLTKTDSIGAKELAQTLLETEKVAGTHVAAHPQVLTTSALTKQGIRAVQEAMFYFAG